MPPRVTRLLQGKAGDVFRTSLEELAALEKRTRFHGTAHWGPRIRSYPTHRAMIMEAANGLKQVQDIVGLIVLPTAVAEEEVEWSALHVKSQGKGKTQTIPRNVWRENTRNLWYAVLVPMTDFWERTFSEDLPGEDHARKQLDDLTTAAELLGTIKFPDMFARSF